MKNDQGSGYLNDDKQVVQAGRKNALKDVEAPLRERVIKKLRKQLVEQGVGEKISNVWSQGNTDREKWLSRQRAFLMEYDEFVDEIYHPGTEWGSALHLPVTLTVGKALHARMQTALMTDPPFVVKAQKGANTDRAALVQELMAYTLSSWTNKYTGVDTVVDKWLWDWVFAGCGIMKQLWKTEYTRFVDVVENDEITGTQAVTDPRTGETVIVPKQERVEREEVVTKKCFDGPTTRNLKPEDVLIVGGDGDPNAADYVIESVYMTASELWTLADRGIFDEETVKRIIQGGGDIAGSDSPEQIKTIRAYSAGEAHNDKTYDLERYRILECYLKLDVDGSGINSDVVVWVHHKSREILRATYLYRISKNGKRPYFKIDFHLRDGATYGVGVVEMMYSLQKEIDAMHNIRMDVGLIASQPIGFYRPSSSMSEERLPIEPGALLPLDNPQTDVYFPNLGNRTAWGFQEEQGLMGYVERLMSVNDIMFGNMGQQGAARTARGVGALQAETNANLDVLIRRMHRGWKQYLSYTLELLQQKIEPGFVFRLTGEDGQDTWRQIVNPESIQGSFDILLEPSSAHSNRQIQIDTANQIYQLTSNPLDLQLGIITPVERFEAIKNLLKVMGVKDYARYLRKPAGGPSYSPQDMANMVLSGVPVNLDPTSDLQGFIAYVQEIVDNDDLLGQFNEQQAVALVKKQREAQALFDALQQQAAQQANVNQQQANASQGQNSMMGSTDPMAQGAPAPSPIDAKFMSIYKGGGQ